MTGTQENKSGTVLVLMPFSKDYEFVYENGIKKPCERLGYDCRRVDERIFDGQIINEIHESILDSDVIVAEMSEPNPNVYYEVGVAHGIGKEVILVTRDAELMPFDLRGFNHVVYSDEIGLLSEKLTERLEWMKKTSVAMKKVRREPLRLREESQAVLVFLHEMNEDRPAAECGERARGLFSVLYDLRFLGYVKFYGGLRPDTPIHLTEEGGEAARTILQEPSGT